MLTACWFWLFHFTYNVLDARFVSSCFNWPSRARPHLSLLLANNGVSWNTFDKVKPGWTWHPSLLDRKRKIKTRKGKNEFYERKFHHVEISIGAEIAAWDHREMPLSYFLFIVDTKMFFPQLFPLPFIWIHPLKKGDKNNWAEFRAAAVICFFW